jgi:hypothetical protein
MGHVPDVKALIGASESASREVKKGVIVVYEFTVCPRQRRGGFHLGARARTGPELGTSKTSS